MVRNPPGMELALLGFLQQGPQHGYRIHQMISDPAGLGLIWHLKQSQLYALLTKLEGDGYLTSALQNQEPHPPRRVFELTALGHKVFFDWLTSPVSVPRLIRQEFLAKLYFAQRENNKYMLQQLMVKQRVVCQNWMAEFKKQLSVSEPMSYRWTMYQYRIGQIDALKKWLESFE
jgi:DNA-binding PadR family transcriptional regulator